jgi:NADH-quinone oxidoreductase subunit L
MMALSTAFALGGVGLAYGLYVRRQELPTQIAQAVPIAYSLSYQKFLIDEIYDWLVVKPLTVLAWICFGVDKLIDGLVNLLGIFPKAVGKVLQPMQNGLVQFYALLMVLGVTGFLLSVLLR